MGVERNAKKSATNSNQTESRYTEWTPSTKTEIARKGSKKTSKASSKSKKGETRKNSEKTSAENLVKNSSDTSNDTNQQRSKPVPESVTKRHVESVERRGVEIGDVLETLNNRDERTMDRRVKRSSDKNSDYVGPGEQVPRTQMFYRHPNLSYEEQQKQLNDTLQAGGANLNFGSAISERILDVFAVPTTTSKPAATRESKEHKYVPVFPNDCNETDVSLAGSRNSTERPDSKNGDSNESVNVSNETIAGTSELQSSTGQQQANTSYINIRDHQKNAENTTSSGISDYDPNRIPYVEVPDYSDIREESLDEQERKNKTNDSVDPGKSIDLEKPSKSSRDPKTNDEVTLSEEKAERLDVSNLEKQSNESISSSKPSNATSSEENNDQKLLKDTKQSLELNSKLTEPAVIADAKNTTEPSPDELEGSNEEESPKSSKGASSNASNSNESDSRSAERSRGKNDEPRDDPVEIQREGDTERQPEPIIFDINEYRKPFNLDEFLKDDPILKNLKLLEKETRAKYGKNGKRVSDDFNESESDNARGERGEAEVGHETFDGLPDHRRSNDFIDMFARLGYDRLGEGNKEQKTSNFDEEEDDPISSFGSNKKIGSEFGLVSQDEFLRGYFTDDRPRNLREGTDVAQNRERKSDDSKEEPASPSKKSATPGERIDGRIEAGDQPAHDHGNFWPAEYKSPSKRVDMEAQETRK
ncbi:uncharacterized protein LOC143433278 [Xylocopa sonorina]|uniref:uncharacterized protein LOC143433278 n=1 Tax=Xylocopa sonorina TaxID=1818115 RepID=UPI00403AD81D